jgi:hypothetical protein
MSDSLAKLAKIGSRALLPPPADGDVEFLKYWGNTAVDLLEWLLEKNGFYAFESALHVFPIGARDAVVDLESWNRPGFWRDAYGDLAEGMLFFAEDVFGNQFAIRNDRVGSFDAETGSYQHLADGLKGWASAILGCHELHSGYPLAHDWQTANRRLEPGERLLPKTPFATGGPYHADNLYAVDAVTGMRLRGGQAGSWSHL